MQERRESAAIRRTRGAMSSIEFALLEFHSLLRRSAVEARFVAPTPLHPAAAAEEVEPGVRPARAASEDDVSLGSGASGGGASGTSGGSSALRGRSHVTSSPAKAVSWVVSTRSPVPPQEAFETVMACRFTFPAWLRLIGPITVRR